MGITEFLAGCFFVLLVVIVLAAAWWMLDQGAKRGVVSPRVMKIATIALIAIGILALAFHFLGKYLPR